MFILRERNYLNYPNRNLKKTMKQAIRISYFILFCLAFFPFKIHAQQVKPPKLGLTLSGGGAKGLAHIGILRILDSLDIQPDYITGTSMGAIMGALYAIGFSGDELKTIALKTNWNALLSNKLPFKDINIEEKDEYGRYVLEIPLNDGKLKLPKGFIEGQALQEFLIDLTFSARHIHHFDSLPIPFRCLATDIETGKPVLITEGSLPEALRTSMAIPLFFTPVERDDKLLVDGGLSRNFPVKEVIDMGATKVIGSYTGFRVLHPEELGDGGKIVLQSIALALATMPIEDQKLCDVWVNNELQGLFSTNFSNVRGIIEGGEANARALLPELQKIADWQHANGIHSKRRILKNDTTLLPLKKLIIHPDNATSALVIERKLGIEINEHFNVSDIKKGLNRLYGSRFFEKITFNIDSTSDGKASIIQLHAQKSPPTVLKFGLHYDTDDAAGILFNGTFRNFLVNNSRLVVTADFAESPKAHVNFYQFMGAKARFRWTLDGLFERTLRNDFLFIKASEGTIKSRDKYFNNYLKASLGAQFIVNKYSLLFAEMRFIHDVTTPRRDPLSIPVPDEVNFLSNESVHKGFAVGSLHNTLDAVFFPTKGERFFSEVKLGFGHNSEFTTYTFNDSSKVGTEKEIITSRNQSYIRYRLDEQYFIPLSTNFSLGIKAGLGAGFSINNNLPKNSLDTIPLDNPETFYIGGSDISERDNTLSFVGLRKAEIDFSQYFRLGISGQYHFAKHFYLTPSVNIARFSDNYKSFFSNIFDWDLKKDINDPLDLQTAAPTHILGYGLNLGYQSLIGPVNLQLHSNTFTHSWYLYFSFGFKMP
jgi:NTE family protein